MASLVKGLKPVGDQLRRLRIAKRLTVEELSASSGISVSMIYKLEGGYSKASLRSLKALDEVFGLGWEDKDPAA